MDEDNKEHNDVDSVDEVSGVLDISIEVVEEEDTFCVNSLDVIVCTGDDIVEDASISE